MRRAGGPVLALLLFAGAACAQTLPDDLRVITERIKIEPIAQDTYTVLFEGRTLSSVAITVSLRKKKQADATPSAIVTNSSVSGSNASFTLAPDTGCGATGCRAGNIYQLKIQPTETGGNKPTANILVEVDTVYLRP